MHVKQIGPQMQCSHSHYKCTFHCICEKEKKIYFMEFGIYKWTKFNFRVQHREFRSDREEHENEYLFFDTKVKSRGFCFDTAYK